LFSADKLIGASQGGIIVGKKELIAKIRKHPFMRAARVDKTCILFLERTLAMFRDPDRLRRENPTYVMMTTSIEAVRARAEALALAIRRAVPHAQINIVDTRAYLGSGSLPEQALPSSGVSLVISGLSTERLAEQLRLDPASVFGRIENDQLLLDARTITDAQLPQIAAALARVCESQISDLKSQIA
jgi:L-seryl-tRNA(Ser) seleniumtransferase